MPKTTKRKRAVRRTTRPQLKVVHPPAEDRRLSIQNLALLARVEIRAWTGERVDETVSDEVATSHNTTSDKAGKYVKSLLGSAKAELSQIRSLAHTARVASTLYSLPWHTEGYRLVPLTKWEEYGRKLKSLQTEYEAAVARFLGNYHAHIETARESLNGLFNPDDYPTVDALRTRFKFRVHMEPIPNPQSFDGLLGLDHVEASLRADLEARLTQTVEEGVQSLRDRIGERLEEVHTKLAGYTGGRQGNFKEVLIANTVELLEVCRGLNMTKDSRIEDWCRRGRTILEVGAEALRADTIRGPAVEALATILREMGRLSTVPQQPKQVNVDGAISKLFG